MTFEIEESAPDTPFVRTLRRTQNGAASPVTSVALSRWKVTVVGLFLLGCGGAKRPASGVTPKPASARAPDATVLGRVVHADEHWPLAGRLVEIAGKRAVTDAAGRFRIENVGANYDVFVSDADGSWVSLYRDVSRRDPVLSHHGQDWKTMGRERHSAPLFVKVEGGVWPLDRDALLIQVRSASTKLEGLWTGNDGPEIGPIRVGWDGAPELDAELLVLRRYHSDKPRTELEPGEVPQRFEMARAALELSAGREARVTLRLATLPSLRVEGTWEGRAKANAPAGNAELHRDFRWIFGKYGSVLHGTLVSASDAFDYGIVGLRPVLSEEPRTLCLRVRDSRSFSQRCGVRPREAVAMSLDEPPRLLAPSISPEAAKVAERSNEPSFGSPLTDRAEFVWQADPGVNRLRVQAQNPSPATPSFDVYTSRSRLVASDFLRDTRLSRSEAAYRVSVTHLAPFATVDAAFAPNGLGTRAPEELRSSTSEVVSVLTVPAPPKGAVMPEVKVPPGMVSERSVPWAPCQHPVGTEIACGGGSWFSLTAINNRLRHFPELAFGTKTHCVTDCAGAAAFVEAQKTYEKAHPGCCAGEPLDLPSKAPPPLPAEPKKR